jgi:hypothetical protein
MAIDWGTVDWVYVALLSGFAFLASLIGHLVSFRSRLVGAILTALLFAAMYVFWKYYPHGLVLPGMKPG